MKHYRNDRWYEFRSQVIDLDSHTCVDCGRTDKEVVLQVHHKKYIKGHLPWEYPFSDCETLCRGCHAREHGEIRPNSGWGLCSQDDLGDLNGSCELCGTAIRHTFMVQHPHWEPMTVGTNCCDNLTGTKEASEFRKKLDRKRTFVNSKRWEIKKTGSYLNQCKIRIGIISVSSKIFKISMNDKVGRKEFDSEDIAKEYAFDLIESGKAQSYLDKIGK